MAGGAYPDDMARFLRLSDEDVERLFRGVPSEDDEDLRDLAFFLTDAAETLSAPPSSRIQARHLARLGEAIGSGPAPERRSTTPVRVARPAMRRSPLLPRTVRWVATVVGAAASLVLGTGALALAGVDLPGTAAETAFQKVFGVELPNQAEQQAGTVPEELPESAADTANAVLDVIRERRSGADWSGCEFGARVSAAARGLEGEPDTSHCEAAGSGGGADAGEPVAGGGSANAANAEEGLGIAADASDGASSSGAANADEGLETAEEASGGRSDGSDNADEGPATAEDGLDIADEASGGSVPDGVGAP
jgi:hypothetical protein